MRKWKDYVLLLGWECMYLTSVVKEGLSEEILFELRPQCQEEANHARWMGKSIQEEGTTCAKGGNLCCRNSKITKAGTL